MGVSAARIILNGSSVGTNCTPGLEVASADVVVRGIGVVQFPGIGVHVSGARFSFLEGVVARNMAQATESDIRSRACIHQYGIEDAEADGGGVRFEEGAVDATIGTLLAAGEPGATASGEASEFAPTFIYGNIGAGISTEAPRTTVARAWIGITADSTVEGNGFGLAASGVGYVLLLFGKCEKSSS